MNSSIVSRVFSKISKGFRHPIKSYKNALERHPIIVQSIQTGIMYGTSDIIAQTIVENKKLIDVNAKRTLVFLSTGACYTGPLISLWFRFLAKNVGTSGTWVVVKKVCLDQLVWAPCFIASLIAVVNTLHGHNWNFIEEEIRLKYFDIITSSIKLWPAVQLINFSLVPTNYQVLFTQTVALFWNIYLSWKTQHSIKKQPQNKLGVLELQNN